MERIPVECIVDMPPDYFRPMRIRYYDEEGAHVINIDRIISKDTKKVLPSKCISPEIEFTFKCEAIQGNARKPFTLIYNNQSCKWNMFR